MKTEEGVPRVITVFSAPNYCDVYGNKGACLVIENEVLNIRQFLHSEHPYYLPNFLDIFSWSLPFVAEKVSDILYNVIGLQDVENDDEDLIRATSISPRRGNQLKTKVRAVTKMVQVFKTLRQENEMILQLKQLLPNQKLPMGLLRQGQQAIRKAVSSFQEALVADSSNEKRPPIDSAEAEDESKELAH